MSLTETYNILLAIGLGLLGGLAILLGVVFKSISAVIFGVILIIGAYLISIGFFILWS